MAISLLSIVLNQSMVSVKVLGPVNVEQGCPSLNGPSLTLATVPSAPQAVGSPPPSVPPSAGCVPVTSMATLGDDICPGQVLSSNLASSSYMSPKGHNSSR